jgi:hypothetical protein
MGLTSTAFTLATQQVRLEDVFRSTQESIDGGTGPGRMVALVLALVAFGLLLAALQYRRRVQIAPKAINHQGKLVKEIARGLPLKAAEMKQLSKLAEQKELSSPLVMLLCPSVLAKSLAEAEGAEKATLKRVAQRITGERAND